MQNSTSLSSHICKGDLVKVRSGRVSKGLSKFRGPFRVKCVYPQFVVLDNDERWNLRRVALYQRATRFADDTSYCPGHSTLQLDSTGSSGYLLAHNPDLGRDNSGVSPTERGGGNGDVSNHDVSDTVQGGSAVGADSSTQPQLSLQRSNRNRRPPAFLKDFVY